MPQIRKRFERLLNSKAEAKWGELVTILTHFGFEVEPPPGGGSHWTVYHEHSRANLTVPVQNNRVKRIYVKKLVNLVESVTAEEE